MIYCFECYADDGGCSHQFEVQASLQEVSKGLNPRCPKCGKIKPVFRNYSLERVGISWDAPKTLGMLAQKNAEKYSEDQKAEMLKEQNAYREGPLPELPDGMKWGAELDTTQLDKDPLKNK